MARIKCPALFCGSRNCIPVTTKKGFKAGKGLINGAIGFGLAGPIGAMVGVGTGLNGKKVVKYQCLECGKIFEVKI